MSLWIKNLLTQTPWRLKVEFFSSLRLSERHVYLGTVTSNNSTLELVSGWSYGLWAIARKVPIPM
eukprot:scaffold30118_cov72-Skeletonema_dohrnii-CCMP3373.AAC.2